MKNLAELAEKINSEIAPNFPFFKCEFSSNICDSVSIRLSLQVKEEWTNNIFHNSPYLIIHIFCERQREENSDLEKYTVEVSTFGLREKKKMRKKTGNLPQIYSHLEKYLLTLVD